jgi:hypothetical protein
LLCPFASFRTAVAENEAEIKAGILFLDPNMFEPVSAVPNAFGLDDNPAAPFAPFGHPEIWRVRVD